MPLSAEQQEAVQTLATADPEEAATALKDTAHPVFQQIFRKGYGTAQGEYEGESGKLTRSAAALQEAQAEAQRLQAQIDELKAKTPDRAAIDQEWSAKLDREKSALQGQLDAAHQKVARLTTDTTAEKAENALLHAGFRRRMAKLLAREAAARIAYGDDGQPILYEPGTKIPVQVPSGKTAFEVLAEEERKVADPADLESGVDAGGGVQGGGGRGGPSDKDIVAQKRASGQYAL